MKIVYSWIFSTTGRVLYVVQTNALRGRRLMKHLDEVFPNPPFSLGVPLQGRFWRELKNTSHGELPISTIYIVLAARYTVANIQTQEAGPR